jgi:hypothetical protein
MAEGPFSEIGEWRMEKTSCRRLNCFSQGVASFTWNPHYKKCMIDEKMDLKIQACE